ncbi:hypothetical protein [Marinobacter sp. M5B]|uniref:hypothetical protein n=1 Tax=Marinobacter sp. M5B TaxID=3141535 RepID=UPI0036D388CF
MPHTLAELVDHNCLLGPNSCRVFSENGEREELKFTRNWRSNSVPALLDAVKTDPGFAQLQDYYLDPLRARSDLATMRTQYRARYLTYLPKGITALYEAAGVERFTVRAVRGRPSLVRVV